MLTDVKRRLRKAKESERTLGKWLLEYDGPDPIWRNITSSTGRVGHITGLQFDVISLHYAAENKNIKLPARMYNWWVQICQIADKHGKDALLRIEPTNEPLGLRKKYPSLHVITEDRHAELLRKEKIADEVERDRRL